MQFEININFSAYILSNTTLFKITETKVTDSTAM